MPSALWKCWRVSVLPEVVVGPRLVLRRWCISDMPVLRDAITASIEHLRPWMSWIAFEPLSDDDREELIRTWENDWIDGEEVVMGAFLGEEAVGGCSFHRRAGPNTLQIGYWVHVDHLRQGYATEMARELTNAAFAVPNIDRVELHHDKSNTRSRAVPEALGFHHDGESQVKPHAPATIGVDVAWSMSKSAWQTFASSKLGQRYAATGFSVREAIEADIPSIRECYLRSWRAAYRGFLQPDVLNEEAEKRGGFDWSREIKSETATVRVAVDSGNRVLGVMQVDEDLPPPRDLPEIDMLYVDPEAWGSQVAPRLLDAGLEWIARRGHTTARLRVVEVHLRARRFYEREGWQLDPELEPAHNGFFRLIYYRRLLLEEAE